MDSTDHQLAMIAEAKKRGWDPARLSPSQHKILQLHVRSIAQKLGDGTRAMVSRGLTTLSLRVVSKITAEGNATKCRTNSCGKYRKFPDGREACDACGCSGKWLQSKWRDANEKCPLPEPLWDNRGKPSTEQNPLQERSGSGSGSNPGNVQ